MTDENQPIDGEAEPTTDDATPEVTSADVSTQGVRNHNYDDIVENHKAKRIAAEAAEQEEPEEEPEPETEEPEVQTTEAATTEEESPEEPQPERKVRLVVDGQESFASEDDVREAGIRALQKESGADARLAEATRLLREAQTTAAAPKPTPEPETDLSALDKEVADALYSGDEEAATAALRKFRETMGRGQQSATPVDAAKLARDAAKIATFRIEQQTAKTKFNVDYPGIASDPTLFKLADQKTVALFKEHPDWPISKVIDEAGKEIEKWASKAHVGQQPPGDEMEARRERKRSTDAVSGASTRAKSKPEPKPKSRKDVVDEMKKSRGQHA